MKKFILSFLLIALCPVFMCACGHRTVKVTGRIEYFGNAPFEFPGFISDDGRNFSLAVDKKAKFTVEDIEKLSGNKIELKGYIDSKNKGPETLNDGTFVVKSYKIAEN